MYDFMVFPLLCFVELEAAAFRIAVCVHQNEYQILRYATVGGTTESFCNFMNSDTLVVENIIALLWSVTPTPLWYSLLFITTNTMPKRNIMTQDIP